MPVPTYPPILTSPWAVAHRACPQACLQGSQTHSGRCALYTDYDSLLVCPTFPLFICNVGVARVSHAYPKLNGDNVLERAWHNWHFTLMF